MRRGCCVREANKQYLLKPSMILKARKCSHRYYGLVQVKMGECD